MNRSVTAPTGPARAVDDEVLVARAFLSRAAEPACIPLWDLTRTHGPVEAVRRLRAGQVADPVLIGLSRRVDTVDPHADLEAAHRHGVRLVVPESDEWPHFALSALERSGEARLALFKGGKRTQSDAGEDIPPLALWVRGPLDISTLGVRSVGIVGARSATTYGQRVASDLAYGLALRDFTVVSGGAYGIDAAAHRGALAAAGTTVVVSAGGVERPYPPSHAGLFERACERGAIVSESPVGCAPRRGRFLTRNRLIAALSTGTVVVEASLRSGALNTAGHAEGIDRPLMAVPGPVTSAMSDGCHALLRVGARSGFGCALVGGVDDVVSIIGTAGDVAKLAPDGVTARVAESGRVAASGGGAGSGGAAPSGGRNARHGAPDLRTLLDTVDATARAVYDGLPASDELTADELAQSCALSVLDVIRSLPALELAGLVEPTRDGYRRRRSR